MKRPWAKIAARAAMWALVVSAVGSAWRLGLEGPAPWIIAILVLTFLFIGPRSVYRALLASVRVAVLAVRGIVSGFARARINSTVILLSLAALGSRAGLYNLPAEAQDFIDSQDLDDAILSWGFFALVYRIATEPHRLQQSPHPRVQALGDHLSTSHEALRALGVHSSWLAVLVFALLITPTQEWGYFIFVPVLIYMLARLRSPRGRDEVYEKIGPHGLYATFVYALAIIVLAIAFFSLGTLLMKEQHWARFAHPADPERARVVLFYAWVLIGSLPLGDIPETMKWSAPIEYTSRSLGVVILVFKATVIIPVIVFVQGYLAWRHGLERDKHTDEARSAGSGEAADRTSLDTQHAAIQSTADAEQSEAEAEDPLDEHGAG